MTNRKVDVGDFVFAVLVVAIIGAACAEKEKGAPAAETPTVCVPGEYDAEGELGWVVVKNGASLVTGHQPIIGTAKAGDDRVTLNIAFDPKPHTGIDLRDQRIADLVFGAGRDLFAFEGTIAAAPPAEGTTLDATAEGTLRLAAQRIPFQVPVKVSWESPTLFEASGRFTVDMRNELGLTSRLASLTALVNATVDDTADVRFTIRAQSHCEGTK